MALPALGSTTVANKELGFCRCSSNIVVPARRHRYEMAKFCTDQPARQPDVGETDSL